MEQTRPDNVELFLAAEFISEMLPAIVSTASRYRDSSRLYAFIETALLLPLTFALAKRNIVYKNSVK
jgi:hypothetical protein